MTLPEVLGGAAAALVAALSGYRAVSTKLDSVLGKKTTPDDDSLRDLVMRIDGKIDAQHGQTSSTLRDFGTRIEKIERHVFTPSEPPAMRVVATAEDDA